MADVCESSRAAKELEDAPLEAATAVADGLLTGGEGTPPTAAASGTQRKESKVSAASTAAGVSSSNTSAVRVASEALMPITGGLRALLSTDTTRLKTAGVKIPAPHAITGGGGKTPPRPRQRPPPPVVVPLPGRLGPPNTMITTRPTGAHVNSALRERMKGHFVVLMKPDEVAKSGGFSAASTLTTMDARQNHNKLIEMHRHDQVSKVLKPHHSEATYEFTSDRVGGFAAHLTHEAAEQIARREDVQAVFPDLIVTNCGPKTLKRSKPSPIPSSSLHTSANRRHQQQANEKKDLLKDVKNGIPWNVERVGGDIPFTPTRAVDVFVVDTGVDETHPDLKDCIDESRSFVPWETSTVDGNGHGTHVCGTIAANGRLKGVAPGTRLHVLKVLDSNGEGSFSVLVAALTHLIKQHHLHPDHRIVVNMSLGTLTETTDMNPVDELVLGMAKTMGIVFVAASGNDATLASHNSPGHVPEIITVGAYDINHAFAPYSNHGPMVDLLAPGSNIVSCAVGGGYKVLSGTSMATPCVTGCVVRYLHNHFDATSDQVKEALLQAAKRSRMPQITGAPTDTCNDSIHVSNL